MIIINYPEQDFRIKKEEGKESIFDKLRKKWIILTPEEWVRQNFIKYLVGIKKYPSSLIATESMEIKLDEAVLQQVLRYIISIPVKFLVITNGSNCFAWEKKDGQLVPCSEIPEMD